MGRIFAAAAVVTMTLPTFASCGPLEFQGLDLIKNTVSVDDAQRAMRDALENELGLTSRAQPSKVKSQTIFEDDEAWLHWMYLAALGVAVLSLFAAARLHRLLGIFGCVLVFCFMVGFDHWFDSKTGETDRGPSVLSPGPLGRGLEFEAGAWLTLAAFAAVSVAGFRSRGGGSGEESE